MNSKRRTAVSAAALVTLVTIACEVPLLPKWEADWNVPLPSVPIKQIFGAAPIIVPAGTSANVVFKQSLPIDGAIGDLLRQQMSNASIIMVVTKSAPLDGVDTLYVAATVADLTNPAAQRIVVPITVGAANAQDSVQAPVSVSGLAMLQGVANAGGALQVRLSGKVTYTGPPATHTFNPSDSIGVRLALLSTIAVSK